MMSSLDDKLQLLSLDNDTFAEGLSNMLKAFLNGKDEGPSLSTYMSGSNSDTANYLLLEDNTPIMGE